MCPLSHTCFLSVLKTIVWRAFEKYELLNCMVSDSLDLERQLTFPQL